jgi:hypothetical protein
MMNTEYRNPVLKEEIENTFYLYDEMLNATQSKILVDSSKGLFRALKQPKRIINSWLYINLRNYLLLKIFRRRRTFFLKYEDFSTDPQKCLISLCDFLKIPYEKDMTCLDRCVIHIMAGNSSRMNATQTKKPDESWKLNLRLEDLKSFNRKAGLLNRLFGYR